MALTTRRDMIGWATRLYDGAKHVDFTDSLLWAWVDYGAQSVLMPETYAAALMATTAFLGESPRLPWPVFEVPVAPTLLPSGVGARDVYSVLVVGTAPSGSQTATPCTWRDVIVVAHNSLAVALGNVAEILGEQGNGAAYFGDTAEVLEAHGVDDLKNTQTAQERAMRMAARLAVNVCTAINSTLPQPGGRATVRRKHGVVRPNTITLGEPLNLDCRRSIRDFVEGKRASSPKVTTLVRGHWRHQVHGPANSLRRLQWIQPFFRGEGPLLVRPTQLGARA